jgi:histidinol dehydrogenase
MQPKLAMPLIRRFSSSDPGFDQTLEQLLAFEVSQDEQVERVVADIVRDVRNRGDAALLEYTAKFDGLQLQNVQNLEITGDELDAALHGLPLDQRSALEEAASRVRVYHEKQKSQSWYFEEADGTRLGQKITPLDRAGLYVPGGKASYPSSVLMNAIPAKVAGVGELIMVVPTPGGVRSNAVLAAAKVAGVDRVFTVGGAQAVAALAYGTATIPKVDKITGPGNAYVAEAKRRVFGAVGIDMIAGPSEILIIADGSTPAEWVAMDLFSQAEHDEVAQAILLCPDEAYINEVYRFIQAILPTLPRQQIASASMRGRGALIHVKSMDEACEIANYIAAEHLEIAAANPRHWADKIRHAGAMFLGAYASESLGDYCAGPNHVLPTMRTCRFSSPLGVYDFQKRTSIIEVSQAGAQHLGRVAATLAYSEGLQAHARSAELRLQSPTSDTAKSANL